MYIIPKKYLQRRLTFCRRIIYFGGVDYPSVP
jgi:hypothetical protein